MMGDARRAATPLGLPEAYTPKDGGTLAFELRLFNAVREQCEMEQLGVQAADVGSCEELLLRVRDALGLMSGREGDFKWAKV